MDFALVVNAVTGQLMSPRPVQFVRIPVPGELVSVPPNALNVVRVVHGWLGPNPTVWLHVSGGGALSGPAKTGHTSPF